MHGIRARCPVVPGLESREEWESQLEEMLAALRPEGRLEKELAERVASVLWRLDRVTRAEREAIALRQESLSS